jgi:hypothetical protein
MIIKQKFLFLLFFILTNCNYEAIYSNKNDLNIPIKNFQLSGNKNINRNIVSSLKLKENKKSGYQLKLLSDSNLEVVSRSSTGSAAIYRSTITVELSLIKQDEIIKQKKFSSSFTYNNIENKFDLTQYQKNIELNLINKITEEIFIFLNK